ncbi:MAG: IS200/IS605 family transposase [Gloeotrichia echinulata DVL01]|nr:IS200/IS605 family transposase [Gloeotrichia echinulata DEX184]MCM0591161.1 IS200/IS605 family transposase [Gloeotrichia echinulata DEX184]MCM0592371.1 IS200/IS605 family transposase [Gloeotrichia echinulata DEX184]MCM0594109.1 IS200/IS605 family transposase [Gloeotrichia echinulata DEX184]
MPLRLFGQVLPRKGSHSVFSIRQHFVFVTKYRRKTITASMLERLPEIFANVCRKTKCRLIEFSGEVDHVHLLVDFHPDNNLSVLVGSLKSASSRIIQKEFSEHLSNFYRQPVFWSSSYYVSSTGGAPIEKIKQYIQSQESPNE